MRQRSADGLVRAEPLAHALLEATCAMTSLSTHLARCAAATSVLGVMSVARAEPPRPPEEHPFDTVRVGAVGSTWAGTRLEGEGSVARVARPAFDLELVARRFYTPRFGVELGLLGFPAVRDASVGYVRGDLGLDVLFAKWDGPTRGGITGVVGLGGDAGRYPFAGRAYPRLGLRARMQASRAQTVELGVEVLPVSLGLEGRVVQHRSELAFGWSLFQAGFRVSHAFHTAGDPARTFMIQELSLFVGVGLMR